MSTTADLDEIYQQYSGTVTAYLTRLSGSPELAEELMQETFYRAVKNIDRFDGRSSVYTWLCGIAKHLYFDSLRRRKPTEPLPEEITLTLEGDIVSRPYIDMTLALMRHHGIEARWHDGAIVVPAGCYTAAAPVIEGDWSAASYWLGLKALAPQLCITLSPLSEHSLQGDRAIATMMEPLGVRVRYYNNKCVTLEHDAVHLPSRYCRDMAATPDLVPTLAVTLCLLRVPFALTGVATLRLKESDRLEALRQELGKLGYCVEAGDNALRYDGNHTPPASPPVLDPHGDHRLAMALSLAATRHHGIVINNAQVVTKSYPTWWQQLLG